MSKLKQAYTNTGHARLSFQDEGHLDRFLDKVNSWCAGYLYGLQYSLSVSEKNPSLKAVMEWGKENRTFPNMCAISQEMVCGAMDASRLQHTAFSSSGFKPGIFNHCATVIPFTFVNDPDNERLALIDPTYNQFQMPLDVFRHSCSADSYALKQPKYILSETDEGFAVWDQLETKGHLILDKDIAEIYLGSLYARQRFDTENALEVLRNSPLPVNQPKHGIERVLEVVKIFPDLRAMHAEAAAQPDAVLSPHYC